jgi:hypothetical protein
MPTPVKKTIGNGKPGPGRPKGVPNKATTALKDMILGALGDNGGQAYLAVQARENPTAFLTLLGKVLPMQVAGEGGEALGIVIFKGLNEKG